MMGFMYPIICQDSSSTAVVSVKAPKAIAYQLYMTCKLILVSVCVCIHTKYNINLYHFYFFFFHCLVTSLEFWMLIIVKWECEFIMRWFVGEASPSFWRGSTCEGMICSYVINAEVLVMDSLWIDRKKSPKMKWCFPIWV